MLGKTGLLPASDTTGQYREVLPHAEEYSFPVMMQSLGADLEIISVNPIWLEVLGYEESEVIGRKSSEFLTEVSRSFGVEIALPKFLETGSERDVAYQMVRKKQRSDQRSSFGRWYPGCGWRVHRQSLLYMGRKRTLDIR